MSHNPALDALTEGYEPVAQMSIKLAALLGYLRDPFYLLIAPFGDETSAGLPFIITPMRNAAGQYEFPSYDGASLHLVAPEYQVLVYRTIEPPPMDDDEQLDALFNFAMAFPPESLIRRFLHHEMLAWLDRNRDYPDIYFALLRMRTAAYRLEGHIDDLEELL